MYKIGLLVDLRVGHAEIQDRVLLEIKIVWIIYPKSLEQLAVSSEKLINSVNQEGLAEPSGAGQETEIRKVKHFGDIFSLVHVKTIFFSDFFKSLNPERQIAVFHNTSSMGKVFLTKNNQFLILWWIREAYSGGLGKLALVD
jgi:hypothetical protein